MHWKHVSRTLLILTVLLFVVGCKSTPPADGSTSDTNTASPSDDTPSQPSAGTSKKASGDMSIDIISGTFVPDKVTVKVGSTVTWTNKDADDHSVSFSEETLLDAVVDPGETTEVTFDTAGTYKYKDKFTGAKGEVTVE